MKQYEFDGLEDGAHYLTITNQGTDGNTFLDLDQAIVRTYMPSMPAVPSVNASANAISANPASSLNMKYVIFPSIRVPALTSQ
jgi:hypothetical protein